MFVSIRNYGSRALMRERFKVKAKQELMEKWRQEALNPKPTTLVQKTRMENVRRHVETHAIVSSNPTELIQSSVSEIQLAPKLNATSTSTTQLLAQHVRRQRARSNREQSLIQLPERRRPQHYLNLARRFGEKTTFDAAALHWFLNSSKVDPQLAKWTQEASSAFRQKEVGWPRRHVVVPVAMHKLLLCEESDSLSKVLLNENATSQEWFQTVSYIGVDLFQCCCLSILMHQQNEIVFDWNHFSSSLNRSAMEVKSTSFCLAYRIGVDYFCHGLEHVVENLSTYIYELPESLSKHLSLVGWKPSHFMYPRLDENVWFGGDDATTAFSEIFHPHHYYTHLRQFEFSLGLPWHQRSLLIQSFVTPIMTSQLPDNLDKKQFNFNRLHWMGVTLLRLLYRLIHLDMRVHERRSLFTGREDHLSVEDKVQWCNYLGLERLIRMPGRQPTVPAGIQAKTVEALFGAIYLDQGVDVALVFFYRCLLPALSHWRVPDEPAPSFT